MFKDALKGTVCKVMGITPFEVSRGEYDIVYKWYEEQRDECEQQRKEIEGLRQEVEHLRQAVAQRQVDHANQVVETHVKKPAARRTRKKVIQDARD